MYIKIKMNFLFYQPLFLGESGVDQLVEIIKVNIIFCYVMELGYHQQEKRKSNGTWISIYCGIFLYEICWLGTS